MGTNNIIRAHIHALLDAANKHAEDAEAIRPGDGSDDHMLDGVDEVENDAIATALDERASELRTFARELATATNLLDVESSGSVQHYIETGRYLLPGEAARYSVLPKHCRWCKDESGVCHHQEA